MANFQRSLFVASLSLMPLQSCRAMEANSAKVGGNGSTELCSSSTEEACKPIDEENCSSDSETDCDSDHELVTILQVKELGSIPDGDLPSTSRCQTLLDHLDSEVKRTISEGIVLENIAFAQLLKDNDFIIDDSYRFLPSEGQQIIGFGIFEIDRSTWEAGIVDDLGESNLTDYCLTPESYELERSHISIGTPKLLQSWRDQKTQGRQEECLENSFCFGSDGLAYGSHYKGGVRYDHGINWGSPGINQNSFRLFWHIESPVNLSVEGVPSSVSVSPRPISTGNCQEITLQVSNSENFTNSSIQVIKPRNECYERAAPFLTEPLALSEDLSEDQIAAILDASHLSPRQLWRPLPEVPVSPCLLKDILGPNSCFQPIIKSFDPYLREFLKGHEDLYVLMQLSHDIRVVAKLDRLTGAIDILESQFITEGGVP
ncbi:hypothetical protein [Pseudobacteriovorax antillogorgiicola]|uniref:Uncharacterized protein n=1 Tax=Pseudobacteriovorax antillogorgiicola TaxID=1513793 RepID=A0A1Y6BLP5_9BACT|nr:hypothetical protein [Pseudobacteriovorax antillogorgiicola]TCS54719.1 hypothetical protein EDD56_106232 [Pseudobacteriovorax antillogorgiicola]SMF16040.1 hypothetical protein SAMN06296036_10611 [Pseudobacteriovorax antillogorgiicola]